MLRLDFFSPDPGLRSEPSRECVCCCGRYPVKRRGIRLFSGEELVGDICPECVLVGPAGAAARVRALVAARGGDPGEDRTSWETRMERRARLLEATASFPLAARQAAVRETRERR